MQIDTTTLRIDFVVTAFTMLVLFYFATYRVTRSSYSAWWCVALTAFLGGSAAYLLDGSSHQWWANPTGSALLALGAASSWAGARSLRTPTLPRGALVAGPALVAVMAAIDDPASNTWAGGSWYLLVVTVMLALGAVELLRLGPDRTPATVTMIVAALLASGFFSFRLAAYLTIGPETDFFQRYAGTQAATLASTVLLVAVSYSMTALSTDRATTELRRRATHDGLTNLLNHTEFLSRTGAELLRVQRSGAPGVLILADLGHFKLVNDAHGHQAGDEVLKEFASACRASVRPTDLVGRYGGEEYVIFMPGSDVDAATDVASRVSRALSATQGHHTTHPTVSYGIAGVGATTTLDELIAAADAALYRAKATGRDRYVIAGRH